MMGDSQKWRLFKRFWRHLWQRVTRGFSDRDTWDLSGTTAHWMLPRLRRFREVKNGYPGHMTPESWDHAIGDMIYALEVCDQERHGVVQDADWERVQKGLLELGYHWRDLWW